MEEALEAEQRRRMERRRRALDAIREAHERELQAELARYPSLPQPRHPRPYSFVGRVLAWGTVFFCALYAVYEFEGPRALQFVSDLDSRLGTRLIVEVVYHPITTGILAALALAVVLNLPGLIRRTWARIVYRRAIQARRQRESARQEIRDEADRRLRRQLAAHEKVEQP